MSSWMCRCTRHSWYGSQYSQIKSDRTWLRYQESQILYSCRKKYLIFCEILILLLETLTHLRMKFFNLTSGTYIFYVSVWVTLSSYTKRSCCSLIERLIQNTHQPDMKEYRWKEKSEWKGIYRVTVNITYFKIPNYT